MPFKLDHVIISVADLPQAIDVYREVGFTVLPGGVHANGATQNALICFQDGSYLELLAPTDQAVNGEAEGIDFSKLTVRGEGFMGYALITDDLENEVDQIRQRGILIESPVIGGRTRPDGSEIRWKTAFMGKSFSPFFIQDLTDRTLRVPDHARIHPNGVLGIQGLYFSVVDMPRFEQIYRAFADREDFERDEDYFLIGGLYCWFENYSQQLLERVLQQPSFLSPNPFEQAFEESFHSFLEDSQSEKRLLEEQEMMVAEFDQVYQQYQECGDDNGSVMTEILLWGAAGVNETELQPSKNVKISICGGLGD
ncbi:MAG: VOC family protein [Anaerolineae bacterium]|jgi:catechol 2,3-dioxygenase-like lactoylglutathione lyase family enzyme|nr:VOC family protein [Anaerolineae bacterium]